MTAQLERTERRFGSEAMERLRRSRVLIFGVGGVGGFVTEALARSGVGALDLCDSDEVALSNLNRQIIATHSTVGMRKVDAFEARIADIDPGIVVRKYPVFYLPDSEEAAQFDFAQYDYVVDAVDTVAAKIDIILRAQAAGVPVISSMGCGNRIDPGKLVITDIYKTKTDPLAKIMRRELKKRGVKHLKVLCSTEDPLVPQAPAAPDAGTAAAPGTTVKADAPKGRRAPGSTAAPGTTVKAGAPKGRLAPGSTAFVPTAAGLMIAAEVGRELTDFDPTGRTKGGRQSGK